ncbi:MAG: glutamine amidotransferase, partial [Elusimicrobiota bacterium]|nr:glutamine amidotransferase [Elusimicrobiota bacterium]
MTGGEKVIPDIGIYLDSSMSMSLPGRMESAVETAREISSSLKDKVNLKFYAFGEDLKEITYEQLGELTPDRPETDLANVIRDKGPHAKILITDGQYNKGRNPLAVNELNAVPVYTTGPPGGRQAIDLAITGFKAPGFAFRQQETEIEFTLLISGPAKEKTRVLLKEGEKVVSSREIDTAAAGEIPLQFTFTPRREGLKNYTLEVIPLEEEINKANNIRSFQLQVNRRKIRLLYVAGRPSWEYSILRRLLKSDWQIDMVTFLILRNPDNITIVPENELSLIHFPAREMFTEEIYDFDILIYENFAYGRFFDRSYLDHIKQFVNRGGAFLMLGGEQSFAAGGYRGTPIEDILPVTMEEGVPRWKDMNFKAALAGEARHPVLDIADDPATSGKLWEELPEMRGYSPGLKVKPRATLLLKGPGGFPLLAAAETGKGRSAALNTHSTWRWCMGLAGEGRSPYYYNQFWYKLIRYLIQSAELKNIQVFPESVRVTTGRRANINIKVVDKYWNEIDDARLDVEMVTPSGKRIPVGPAESAGQGWYRLSVPVNEEGKYIITASGAYRGYILGRGEARFSGTTVRKEYIDTTLNETLLEDVAGRSQGKYFTHV